MKKLFGLLGVLVLLGAGCASQEIGVPIEDIHGDTMMNDDTTMMEGDEMMEDIGDVMEEHEDAMMEEGEHMMDDNEITSAVPANGSTVPETVVRDEDGAVSISVSAKRYEFTPSTIRVHKGDMVHLSLTATDVSHGISIPEFGVSVQAEAGKTATTDFVADREGTFTFRCNVFCGSGHSTMTGTLIVE